MSNFGYSILMIMRTNQRFIPRTFISKAAANLASFCLLLTLSLMTSTGLADVITLSYLDRPPYYFSENKKASGMLVSRVEDIISAAGLQAKYILRPPKRIIRELKISKEPYCSIGWFKNEKRTTFAEFSDVIYQNKPIIALTLNSVVANLEKHKSLKSLFKDRAFKLGHISEFSYGTGIDELITQLSPNAYAISGQQNQLIRMLALRRISYILIAPEEIETLIISANLNPADFSSVVLDDIPDGNKRYLMCNKNIGDDIMGKINAAIKLTVIKKTAPLQKQ